MSGYLTLQALRQTVLAGSVLACIVTAQNLAYSPRKTLTDDRSYIDPAGTRGAIRRGSSESELVRAYGESIVSHGRVDIGEGFSEPATVLFAGDPYRKIMIAWGDEKKKRFPLRIQVEGTKSLWSTVGGITLGTTLKTLEKLNEGTFALAGFEWDYSGAVLSWKEGKLDNSLHSEKLGYEVVLRLSPPSWNENHVVTSEEESVLGDGEFFSSYREMQTLNPAVYQMIWLFSSSSERQSTP